ncbi:DUF1569 domain-containing protein [Botrimarina sp.]|uniref:DUF1569 domain-containing protein n=1 Tax=Botrimarina sp. TaxID=2795802 RepID=UPI0032EE37EE
MPRRRRLDLRSLDDVIAEVRRLRADGYVAHGKWNLSQMADHLCGTMRVGMDGGEPRLAWPLRKVTGSVLWLARRSRWMPSGLGTLPQLTPPALEADDPAKIDRLEATLAEARDFAGPLPPYPLADGLSVEQWRELMVVHAQHHLRFLEPAGS